MTYQETTKYLFSQLPQFEKEGASGYKPGLERVETLLELCGSPHKQLTTLHIAGSNGKGSSSTMLAATLAESGLRVGLFTSPHLVDFRERIRINGEMVSEEFVVQFVEMIRQKMPSELSPTFFELTTALAFAYFATEQVDIAVIEVGMGGRLDSTNVIHPLVSLITNVSMDHAQYLGNTLPLIAGEKAGIIKPHTPVVLSRSSEKEVTKVVVAKAKELQAPLTLADREEEILMYQPLKIGYKVTTAHFGTFTLPLGGEYQIENLGGVLQVLLLLRTKGYQIEDAALHQGLQRLSHYGLRGRLEVLQQANPTIVIDTGHNPDAWQHLAPTLQQWQKEGGLVMLIGMAGDKDVPHVVTQFPLEAHYIFCQAHTPRALPATELQALAQAVGVTHSEVFPDIHEAYKVAIQRAKELGAETLFVGGSNYVIGELLTH